MHLSPCHHRRLIGIEHCIFCQMKCWPVLLNFFFLIIFKKLFREGKINSTEEKFLSVFNFLYQCILGAQVASNDEFQSIIIVVTLLKTIHISVHPKSTVVCLYLSRPFTQLWPPSQHYKKCQRSKCQGNVDYQKVLPSNYVLNSSRLSELLCLRPHLPAVKERADLGQVISSTFLGLGQRP